MSKLYTVSQVAEILGVSVSSARRYADDLSKYLSPSASPGAYEVRELTELDVRKLFYARELFKKTRSTDDVLRQVAELPKDEGELNKLLPAFDQLPLLREVSDGNDTLPREGNGALQAAETAAAANILYNSLASSAEVSERLAEKLDQLATADISDLRSEIAAMRDRITAIELELANLRHMLEGVKSWARKW